MDKIPIITSILEFLSAIFPFFKKEEDSKQVIQQNTEGDNIHADNIQINHDYSTNIHYQNSFYPDIDEDYEIKYINHTTYRNWGIGAVYVIFGCILLASIFKEYSHFKYTMLLFEWHIPIPKVIESSVLGMSILQTIIICLLALRKVYEAKSYVKKTLCSLYYILLLIETSYCIFLNMSFNPIRSSLRDTASTFTMVLYLILYYFETFILFETKYTKPNFKIGEEKMKRATYYLGFLFINSLIVGIEFYVYHHIKN